MIELRFYSGKGYGATKVLENDDYYLSVGTDADDKKIAVVELKKLGIYLVGDEELFAQTEGATDVATVALKFILKHLTPEQFCELLTDLTKDRYSAGYADGKDDLQKAMQDLLGISDLFA
ncbi:MAG: hypothetical protein M0R80_07600 [Proteobacteria bacterium]|jgi:hypothetical protein|nr:hypothetical protein [Pseudomonadota bacterium]